jgi:hypothetical protein
MLSHVRLVDTRWVADRERCCTLSQAWLTARPRENQALATSERARQDVCSFTSGFADGVVDDAAYGVAETFFELFDVFLVGGWDLGDLV